MQKKAGMAIATLTGIIFALMVFASFTIAAWKGGSPGGRDRGFVAKDTELIIDSIYALPSEAKVEAGYNQHFRNIKLVIKEGTVQAMGKDAEPATGEFSGARSSYTMHADYTPLDEEVLSDSLHFFKRQGDFRIQMALQDEDCPEVHTANRNPSIKLEVDDVGARKKLIDYLQDWHSETGQDLLVRLSTSVDGTDDDTIKISASAKDLADKEKAEKLACLLKKEMESQGKKAELVESECDELCLEIESKDPETPGIIYVVLKRYYQT